MADPATPTPSTRSRRGRKPDGPSLTWPVPADWIHDVSHVTVVRSRAGFWRVSYLGTGDARQHLQVNLKPTGWLHCTCPRFWSPLAPCSHIASVEMYEAVLACVKAGEIE